MPSSDTNLQHLTTKALLLISGAHRPWLTAWHAERIKGKECGKEGQASKILHPQKKISLHVSKQIQISFCPWWCEITCPHNPRLLGTHVCTVVSLKLFQGQSLCWLCPTSSCEFLLAEELREIRRTEREQVTAQRTGAMKTFTYAQHLIQRKSTLYILVNSFKRIHFNFMQIH